MATTAGWAGVSGDEKSFPVERAGARAHLDTDCWCRPTVEQVPATTLKELS